MQILATMRSKLTIFLRCQINLIKRINRHRLQPPLMWAPVHRAQLPPHQPRHQVRAKRQKSKINRAKAKRSAVAAVSKDLAHQALRKAHRRGDRQLIRPFPHSNNNNNISNCCNNIIRHRIIVTIALCPAHQLYTLHDERMDSVRLSVRHAHKLNQRLVSHSLSPAQGLI